MFYINNQSHKSIYSQIVDQIKDMIINDVLEENSKLPSLRELSKTLMVNPNTVQKAFKQLDSEGYIYTISGKGTFVNFKKNIKVNPLLIDETLSKINDLYKQLLYLGLSSQDAKNKINQIIEGNDSDD